MKKVSLLLSLLLFLYLNVSSQVINNLVVFANDGEKFTLILNGEKQNLYPETKVRVTDLTLKVYKVNILFENKSLKPHSTDLTFFSTNRECIFSLNPHGKKHTMDYVTETLIIQPEKKPVTSDDNNTGTNTSTNSNNTNTNTSTNSNNTNTNTNTGTSTNSSSGGNNDVAVKTKLGTIGVGSNGVKIGGKNINVKLDEKNKTANSSINVLGNDITMNKSLKTGCESPMASLDFAESKKTIVSQASDSTKMIAAEKVINANCLLTAQVKEIMVLFTKDITRLHFAKEAYSHTSDLSNYNDLEDTFTSEEGKKDLKDFIKNSR
jgi:hypothetical protein